MSIIDERGDIYGDPEPMHMRIADLWSAYTGYPLSGSDAAIMLALLKIARMRANITHRDNFTDALGYIEIAERMVFGDE